MFGGFTDSTSSGRSNSPQSPFTCPEDLIKDLSKAMSSDTFGSGEGIPMILPHTSSQ